MKQSKVDMLSAKQHNELVTKLVETLNTVTEELEYFADVVEQFDGDVYGGIVELRATELMKEWIRDDVNIGVNIYDQTVYCHDDCGAESEPRKLVELFDSWMTSFDEDDADVKDVECMHKMGQALGECAERLKAFQPQTTTSV